jgi:uncharacterized protein DUF2817
MNTRAYFSSSYAEARHKFRDAAAQAGARVESHVNPDAHGPRGEALATDVARLGPEDAPRVLVTISGTHGAEGFAGAGVQTGTFLSGFAHELPAATALLAIHAINPYGFAWVRRVTEKNVDLNRNFVDFDRKPPENEGYLQLADAICPAEWTAPSRAAAQARLDEYGRRHGAGKLQQAISGGQYTHPEGVFYGGSAPSWSRLTLLAIAARHLAKARRVAVIDYHTGLGPWGHGERIVVHRRGSAALARAQEWYGPDITSTSLGTSTSSDVVGDALTGLEGALAPAEVTGIALEYGVRPLAESLDALRADNWLHLHGRLDSEQGRAIKAAMRDVFYGDADDWKDAVFARALDTQRLALRGLQG